MVEASPNALILINNLGNIAYLNSFAEKLFQYNKNELIGRELGILIPDKFKKNHPSLIHMYFDNPLSRRMGENRELYAVRKDGTEFPVEIGLNPIVTVDGTMVLAAIIDITERKKAENQFRLIVESIPNAIILVNSSGDIIMSNKQADKQFGYTRDEFVGNKLEMLVPESFKNKHVSFRNMFLENPETRAMGVGRELFAKRKDGTEFPAEIGLNPIDTESGTLILSSIIDITERKKLENIIQKNTKKIEEQNQKLKQSEQELKELNATKDKLFAIIGHDLRGPIGGFKSLIELLISGFDLSDSRSLMDILQLIQKSANSTYDLLENLLAWAKSQQNEIIYAPEKIKFKEIVLLTIDLFSELSKNKGITIIDNVPENTIVFADKNMLMTILRNLISNAIKFTPKGKQIQIIADKNNDEHIVTIKDEGTGIKPENLVKLFKKTEHLSTNGTNGEKGSGLGLLLCKDFIEKQNGKIWVESEIDKGSAFIFTLPIKNHGDN